MPPPRIGENTVVPLPNKKYPARELGVEDMRYIWGYAGTVRLAAGLGLGGVRDGSLWGQPLSNAELAACRVWYCPGFPTTQPAP